MITFDIVAFTFTVETPQSHEPVHVILLLLGLEALHDVNDDVNV